MIRLLCLVCVVWLIGCQATPTISPTPLPIEEPRELSSSTATLPLSATATLPLPVVVPATSTPLPSPTSIPEPSPTINQLISPDQIPDHINPLTGEVVDASVLARRPIAIKISNSSAVVRPQAGLNDADLVFEHYAEGGITRFTAIFYSHDAPLVGPIRSGRLIDLEIPKMYDAAFAYSGSSGPVRLLIQDSIFFERVISPDFGHGGFWRDSTIGNPNKPGWETLYTNTETLRFILQERGQNSAPYLPSNLLFSEELPAGGTPANNVSFLYLASSVYWQYDAGTNRYYRWTDGETHLDANSNEQLNFRNVIAVGANHVETLILEDEVAGGHYSIEIQLWGEGPATIFRNGQRFEGHWQRTEPNQMITFYDLNGNMLPLSAGNSFIQLVPLGFTGMK